MNRLAPLPAAAICAALSLLGTYSLAADGLIPNAVNVEDLQVTPDGRWIIASSMAVGKQRGTILGIDARARTVHQLYPLKSSSTEPSRLAAAGECASKGAPSAFAPHGLALHETANEGLTLRVVNHGGRESIETFAVALQGRGEPRLTWSGCIELPPGTMANSVTIGRDGTLFATAAGAAFPVAPKSSAPAAAPSPIPPSGILAWEAKRGWRVVPAGPLSLSNGIVLSADERYLYVADWSMQKIIEVDLQRAGSQRTAQLEFLPDNLRQDANGFIWVAGQHAPIAAVMNCYLSERASCDLDSGIARLDPRTMQVACSQSLPAVPGFSSATVALPLPGEVWLGSFRAGSIATKPLAATAAAMARAASACVAE